MTSGLVHYHVDHVIHQNALIFGHGWIFHETAALSTLFLETVNCSVPIHYGSPRPDVAKAHPSFPNARQSGFLLFLRVPEGAGLGSVNLTAQFTDRSRFSITLPRPVSQSTRWGILRSLVIRSLNLVRRRAFRGLLEKSRRHYSFIKMLQSSSGNLESALARQKTVLIIDHDFGGGANNYRIQKVDQYLKSGMQVMLLTYQPVFLTYRIDLYVDPSSIRRYKLKALHQLLDVLVSGSLTTVLYNNAVGFPDALQIPALIESIIEKTGARFEMAVHDFFSVCPSPHLINCRGVFCGIPDDLSTCDRCLSSSAESFVQVYGVPGMAVWRSQWVGAIQKSAVVRVFSHSSLELLKRVYKDIDSTKVCCQPHSLERPTREAVICADPTRIRIGVVGNITHIKGSHVVVDLVKAIETSARGDIELIVIGTLHAVSAVRIKQTGVYANQNLLQKLEEEKINVVLFPSICPETFSYVIHEVKATGIPIVAFDLGAQSEYLRDYKRSLLLPLGTQGVSLLENIVVFIGELYTTPRNG